MYRAGIAPLHHKTFATDELYVIRASGSPLVCHLCAGAHIICARVWCEMYVLVRQVTIHVIKDKDVNDVCTRERW
jgi:hypothetical protein